MSIPRKPTHRKPPPDVPTHIPLSSSECSLTENIKSIALNSSDDLSHTLNRGNGDVKGTRSQSQSQAQLHSEDCPMLALNCNSLNETVTIDKTSIECKCQEAHSATYHENEEKPIEFRSCLQLFWKFHIERFDPGFYLTTNPTLRHVQCRSSPGYFVTVHKDLISDKRKPVKDHKPSSKVSNKEDLFLMVFEDTATGEPVIVIRSTAGELEYDILIPRIIKEGHLVYKETVNNTRERRSSGIEGENIDDQCPCPSKNGTFVTNEQPLKKPTPPPLPPRQFLTKLKQTFDISSSPTVDCDSGLVYHQGRCFYSPIPTAFFPLSVSLSVTTNYETDLGQKKYNLGMIPQAREHHFALAPDDKKDIKLIRKRFIYFHQEFFGSNTQYADLSLALVLAFIRPCETRAKKRILRKIHNLSNPSNIGQGPFLDLRLWKDWPDWDWHEWTDPRDWAPNKYQNENLQLLLPEIKPYSDIGDGLHFDKAPIDDEPDHIHKYGWLTVYDLEVFNQVGIFDAVVALTVAASYKTWQS